MIINDFNIRLLQTIREQKINFARQEAEFSKPLIMDNDLMPLVYKWFCELSHCDYQNDQELKNEQKLEFLLIALSIFSPITLAGGKTRRGVREKLAQLLKYDSASSISNHCKNIIFSYLNYEDYRTHVDFYYLRILDRLNKEGIISL